MRDPSASTRVLRSLLNDRSSYEGGIRADKSAVRLDLVKGGAAEPSGCGPSPVGDRLPGGPLHRPVERLKELGGGRVAGLHVSAQGAVQHRLERLAHIVAPSP